MKKIVVGIISFLICIFGFNYFLKHYSSDSTLPKIYTSVKDFEYSVDADMFEFVDCALFIKNSQTIFLKDESQPILIYSSGVDNEKTLVYDFEIDNDFYYRVSINPEYYQLFEDINKDQLLSL